MKSATNRYRPPVMQYKMDTWNRNRPDAIRETVRGTDKKTKAYKKHT
jgi:hypothetical protein